MNFVSSRPDVVRSSNQRWLLSYWERPRGALPTWEGFEAEEIERLLLPFSHDGFAIDRILASLETVSPEGEFDNRDVLSPSRRHRPSHSAR